MTQSKRKRAPARGPEFKASADGPLWLHAEATEQLGLEPAEAERVIADARLVDQWVLANNSAHHGELVKTAASAWSGESVDRLNAALALLETAGRVHRVG